jgi:molecular chaperone GrpE
MSRLFHPRRGRPLPPDSEAAEDIEILEVVGLDEDGIPIAASDPEDVEVVFDESATPAEPAAREERRRASSEDAELRERLLRLQADFENFKKRIERERLDHFRYATIGLVARILPVLDNFERAMSAARPGTASDALVEGVALIHRQLVSELEVEGLRVMECVGEPFDPLRHEAVATDPDSPMPPHTVTQEFQKGYFLHDRVLRPAMVRVRVDALEGDARTDDRKES